jgi:hypothetical protein
MRSFDTFLYVFAFAAGGGGGLVLVFQFLALRVRNSALPAEERDPHLGRKFALALFLHLAVMLLLTGLTVSIVDVCENMTGGGNANTPMTMRAGPGWPPPTPPPAPVAKPFFNTQQRVAAGLMLSGVLHGLLFAMLLYFATNARKFPAVTRAFVVNRLLVAGIILMSITTGFCLMLFSEGDMMVESFGRILGMALVWGPTALGHFLWLMFGMNRDKAKAKRKKEEEDERPRRRQDEDDDEDERPRRRRGDDD